jgi:hypothetical protein
MMTAVTVVTMAAMITLKAMMSWQMMPRRRIVIMCPAIVNITMPDYWRMIGVRCMMIYSRRIIINNLRHCVVGHPWMTIR